MTEKLNRKYCADIHVTNAFVSLQELQDYCKDVFFSVNISGPYWAVLSYPLCTKALQDHAFGEVHMLSHIAGASERVRRKGIEEKEKKLRKANGLAERYLTSYN